MKSNQKPFFMIYSVAVRISIRFRVNNFRFGSIFFSPLHTLSFLPIHSQFLQSTDFIGHYFGPLVVFSRFICLILSLSLFGSLCSIPDFFIVIKFIPSHALLSQFVWYLPSGCGTCISRTHLYCDILFSVTQGIQHINHFSSWKAYRIIEPVLWWGHIVN